MKYFYDTRNRLGGAILFLAIWLLLTMTHSACGAQRYAIIVGVNACPEFRLVGGGKPRPLRGAEHDAAAMRKLLQDEFHFPAKNIRFLTGEKATFAALRSAFGDIRANTKKGDTFVFYFAGHGTQAEDKRPFDEDDGFDEALCAFDARATGENLLYDDQLGLWIDDLHASRITVILDCCHAGTGVKDPDDELTARYLPSLTEKRATRAPERPWREIGAAVKGSLDRRLTAFYACRAEEQAYERRFLQMKPPRRHGQFTFYFLEGLSNLRADKNNDDRISNEEIHAYVKVRLDEKFNRNRDVQDRQTPTIKTDFGETALFEQE